MMAARSGVVYVVAKAPRPGACKTRLCPPLQPDQAARLAGAFLLDSLTTVRQAHCAARVICCDIAEQLALEAMVAGLATVCVQSGAGLGNALETAFRHGLADGFPAVGVLGADTPTLPPDVLREAFAAVARGADVALGPSDDGGYYLLVARALYPQLFHNMPWSTSSVAAMTLDRCCEAGLNTYVVPAWYDVDDAAALARLQAHLLQAPASLAPHTRAALAGGVAPPRFFSRQQPAMGYQRPAPVHAVGQGQG